MKNLKVNGFTLIELLITVGILSLALTLTTGVLVSVIRSYNRQRMLVHIQNSGDFALSIIKENLRRAVDTSCLDLDFSPTSCSGAKVLKITTLDDVKYIGHNVVSDVCSDGVTQNGYVFVVSDPSEYDSTDSSIRITNDNETDGINVESLEFSFLSGSPERVSVTMTVKEPCKESGVEKVFNTLVTLRGT